MDRRPSALLVPLGLVASMVDMVRETAPAHNDSVSLSAQPQFLGLEFQSMVVFAILLTLAVRMRNDLAAHKRLMVLLLVCVLDPGTARAWSFFSPFSAPGPFGWWLSYFWANATLVVAMIGWDLWRHGRIHPALIWGGGVDCLRGIDSGLFGIRAVVARCGDAVDQLVALGWLIAVGCWRASARHFPAPPPPTSSATLSVSARRRSMTQVDLRKKAAESGSGLSHA